MSISKVTIAVLTGMGRRGLLLVECDLAHRQVLRVLVFPVGLPWWLRCPQQHLVGDKLYVNVCLS